MPGVELTSDAWELILDIFDNELDYMSLRALALTCKAMISPCRRRLFSVIVLDGREASGLLNLISRFHKLVTDNPAIIHYVQHFEHHLRSPHIQVTQIFEILAKSTTLRSIKLHGDLQCGERFKWNSHRNRYSNPLQTALAHLILVPTVTILILSSMESVPTSIFSSPNNITILSLHKVTFIQTNNTSAHAGRVTSTLRPISLIGHVGSFDALQLLMRPSETVGDASIIDFGRVRDVEFCVHDAADFKVVCQILHMSRVLESLDISTNYEQISWAGFGRSLSASTVGTLRKLKIETFAGSKASNPLCDLLLELDMIVGTNILEEVSLKATMTTNARCWVDTDDWSTFDCLLTTPGSFPMLRVVTVDILWYISLIYVTDEDIVDRVTERDFPKLLNSADLEFRFSNKLHQ